MLKNNCLLKEYMTVAVISTVTMYALPSVVDCGPSDCFAILAWCLKKAFTIVALCVNDERSYRDYRFVLIQTD